MANGKKRKKAVNANWKALNASTGRADASGWRRYNSGLSAFFADNKRILMPVILIVAVVITVVVAINANRRSAQKLQEGTSGSSSSAYEIPDVTMEENAYPEVNALVEKYYKASADGDKDTITQIYKGLDDTEILKAMAASEYIESYDNITVYTKPGPVEGSYIAYVYNEVKLYNYDGSVPGLETLYICTDDSGNLYINGDIADENELEYIKEVNVQADVIDLNNKVASSYNELVSGDEKLAEVLTNMRSGLQVSVGEALATNEAAAIANANAGEDDGMETIVTSRVIRATDVINIRKSDSETGDILGKTERGQEFKELERLANGWSRIEYNGDSAYVKTEFFDTVSEETTQVPKADNSQNSDNNEGATGDESAAASSADSTEAASSAASESSSQESASESGASKTLVTKTGKLRTTDSVKLRKGQGTDTEALDTIYQGEYVNVLEHLSNGWSKVEYNKKTGYIKTEFLEE